MSTNTLQAVEARQTSSPDTVVPVRRPDFSAGLSAMPKYFAENGNVFESHLAMVMSTMFPDGEEFFIRAVRQFRSDITDPILRKQVAGFIGQESVHGREHRDVNERFAELGYPAAGFERFVNIRLRLVWKLIGAKARLAGTAAVEHFTACLAEVILADRNVRSRFGSGVIQELFCWHALEELEHKAVAFDVYRAVGGTERMRIAAMKVVRVGFFGGLALMMLISLALDREARSPKRLRRDWPAFKASPLLSREFRAMLAEYDVVGFHPNDRESEALLVKSRDEFFGDDGTLRHLLAS